MGGEGNFADPLWGANAQRRDTISARVKPGPCSNVEVTGVAIPVDSWDSAENARRYAEFARMHPTYRQTSRDLVGLASPAENAQVSTNGFSGSLIWMRCSKFKTTFSL